MQGHRDSLFHLLRGNNLALDLEYTRTAATQATGATECERSCAQAEAATILGVNRRTLDRHLRHEGTSFRNEQESARFAQAKLLLSDASLSAASITDVLGYADTSTFCHAFKRWSGVSPIQWRKVNTKLPAKD